MQLYVVVAVVVVAAVQLAGGYLLMQRQQQAIERLEDRLMHLVAGLTLLTDTTEGGLRDLTQEVGRAATASAERPRARAATQRRVANAARRGRSVQEIAAAEQLSEGEVKLRLKLADSPRRPRATAHDAAAGG